MRGIVALKPVCLARLQASMFLVVMIRLKPLRRTAPPTATRWEEYSDDSDCECDNVRSHEAHCTYNKFDTNVQLDTVPYDPERSEEANLRWQAARAGSLARPGWVADSISFLQTTGELVHGIDDHYGSLDECDDPRTDDREQPVEQPEHFLSQDYILLTSHFASSTAVLG